MDAGGRQDLRALGTHMEMDGGQDGSQAAAI